MSNPQIDICDKYEILRKPSRYKIMYGGRGGGKSHSVARMLLILGVEKKLRILCTRELQRSIQDSVHRILSDLIIKYQLDDIYQVMKSSIIGINGTEFLFAGLRSNVSEIKSMEGINICWIEEAQKVSEESLDFLIPTIREDGSEIWATFNPDEKTDPIYKRFIVNKHPDAVLLKINYNENPWFPETLRREMEYDKKNNHDKYRHVWEGEPRSISDAQIFKGKYSVDNFDTPDGVTFYHGADWGFANDPTCLVRCFIQGANLYIDQEVYGVGVDIDEIPAFFRQIPTADKWTIRADSARPETISYLNRQGFDIVRSIKGAGSVEDGIAFLRSFEKIIIHERCKHTINEFNLYSYKKDRITGEILPIIVDANNNCIDAIRYALELVMRSIDDDIFTAIV